MKLRKLHEFTPWDERNIFRAHEGWKLRGGPRSDEEWAAVFATHRLPPDAPPLWVRLEDGTIELHPAESAGQLELGAIAHGLPDWRVSNARDVIDPELPFRLWPVFGTDAFTKSNSWKRRIYDAPMLLRRDDQRYVAGWDGFHAALSIDPDRSYSVGELSKIGEKSIAATLGAKEAHDFWMARR